MSTARISYCPDREKAPPEPIRIYHIVHISKLPAIRAEGLLADAEIRKRPVVGETIGHEGIKKRRLSLPVKTCPGLHVGECVPFYFCPRSPMLYCLNKGNLPGLAYQGGQEPILHLAADLRKTVAWASTNNVRWAFTTSNAGSSYFVDYANLNDLDRIDWKAIRSKDWKESQVKESKQAEFLIERNFPWHLVDEIGVYSSKQREEVRRILGNDSMSRHVKAKPDWYY